jgi:hypothetical protein
MPLLRRRWYVLLFVSKTLLFGNTHSTSLWSDTTLPCSFAFQPLTPSPAICFYVQVEGNLRGATTIETSEDLEHLDRELQLSLGSSSRSISFSVASASYGAKSCFDPYRSCMEWGMSSTETSTDTNASGNSFAIADSYIELWVNSFCSAHAKAYGRACTFSKVDGDIKVDTTSTNGYKEVSLAVNLKTATKTLAFAKSEADAQSYVDIDTSAYTDVKVFCAAVNNKSPYCGASTDLEQFATAKAEASGSAKSLALSGSVTKQNVSVNAKGRSVDYINGNLSVFAKSWAFADAYATAEAFATACTEVANESFAEVCVGEHGRICGDSKNQGKGICGQTATVACAEASAKGSGHAKACSHAVAARYVEAEAKAIATVDLSANLDCRSLPKLTWEHSRAGQSIMCN